MPLAAATRKINNEPKKGFFIFALEIPGFGAVQLRHLVTDFTGTLPVDGKLFANAVWRLNPKRLKAALRF